MPVGLIDLAEVVIRSNSDTIRTAQRYLHNVEQRGRTLSMVGGVFSAMAGCCAFPVELHRARSTRRRSGGEAAHPAVGPRWGEAASSGIHELVVGSEMFVHAYHRAMQPEMPLECEARAHVPTDGLWSSRLSMLSVSYLPLALLREGGQSPIHSVGRGAVPGLHTQARTKGSCRESADPPAPPV